MEQKIDAFYFTEISYAETKAHVKNYTGYDYH